MPSNTAVKATCFYSVPEEYYYNPGKFVKLERYSFRRFDAYDAGLIYSEANGFERMCAYAEQLNCKTLYLSVPLVNSETTATSLAIHNAGMLAKQFKKVKLLPPIDFADPLQVRNQLLRMGRSIDFVALGGNRITTAIASERALWKAISKDKWDVYYAKLSYPNMKFSRGCKSIMEFPIELPSIRSSEFRHNV
jgi:hypothetical protein